MKISEAIAELEKLKEKYGDLKLLSKTYGCGYDGMYDYEEIFYNPVSFKKEILTSSDCYIEGEKEQTDAIVIIIKE